MTRLPQATQAIITTRRVVSGKVFRTVSLQVIAPVLGALTIHNGAEPSFIETKLRPDDDDCFYYHSWRNNVVIVFGTLSSFIT